jgi:hypothetical protein
MEKLKGYNYAAEGALQEENKRTFVHRAIQVNNISL